MIYEYIIIYRFLKEDGYWSNRLTFRHFSNSCLHKKAEKQVKKLFDNQYKEYEIISISMV